MHKAALYQRANNLQRRDAKQVLEEFSGILQWRPDGEDSLLDIGCGSGDVTIDFILPLMPVKFSRLIGTDISEQMVRYAGEQYKHPKISFDKMDIASDLGKSIRNSEPFDHVMSFYCLHWIQNQEQAIQNIFNLLHTDGDCLLVFLANNPIFDIYKQLSENERWSKYMKDVNRFISPYQYSVNPADDFGALLYRNGFTEYSVEVRDKLFIFESVEMLKSKFLFIFPLNSSNLFTLLSSLLFTRLSESCESVLRTHAD